MSFLSLSTLKFFLCTRRTFKVVVNFRYKSNVDCTAEYIYEKCNKLNVKCSTFNLNKNKRNCKKGDYLKVNGKK